MQHLMSRSGLARRLPFAVALAGLACSTPPDGSLHPGSGGTMSSTAGGTQATGGTSSGFGGAGTVAMGGSATGGASATGGVANGAGTAGAALGGAGSGGAAGGATATGGAGNGGGGQAGGGSSGGAGSGGANGGAGGIDGMAGDTAVGGAGTGGQIGTAGSAGTDNTAGSGAGGPPVIDIEIASSIPGQYGQPVSNPGQVVKLSYPVHYYTDQTQAPDMSSWPTTKSWVLPRRDQAITKQCNVYVPPDYDAQKQYPVIFVLHGITDNEETWFERGSPRPNVLIDNLIRANVIKPVIAVFPNGNATSTFMDRDFGNQAGYYYFGNELMNDLLPFIESKYSLMKDRGARAITGFSMGGMQTINVGMCQNLSSFAWFAGLAAAPSTYRSSQIATCLQTQNQVAPNPIYYFYNVVGRDDSTAGSSHGAAVSTLRQDAPQYVTSSNFHFHEVAGGHVYPTASVGLYNILRLAFSK